MGMGVAVVMRVVMVMTGVVGMVVRHEKMLHYNITGVYALARRQGRPCRTSRPTLRPSFPRGEEKPEPRRLNAAADEGDQFP